MEAVAQQHLELVDQAEKWARSLVRVEAACTRGDLDGAIRRVARRAGVSPTLIWAFHYRKPKDIWGRAYTRLQSAYERERARQLGRIEDGLRKANVAGVDPAVVRAIASVAGVPAEFLDAEDQGKPEGD